MAKFTFRYYKEFENGKFARLETEDGIPLNVQALPNSDFSLSDGDECEADVFGCDIDEIKVYKSEKEFRKYDDAYAIPSMIPAGTFGEDLHDEKYPFGPIIWFVGTVMFSFKQNSDEFNYFLGIETLGFSLFLKTKYDAKIEKGNIVFTEAYVFGTIRKA